MVGMTFRRLFSLAFPVTVIQYAIIMTIGYYLGYSYQTALVYIEDVGIIIALVLVVFIIGYISLQRFAYREIVELENKEEEEMKK